MVAEKAKRGKEEAGRERPAARQESVWSQVQVGAGVFALLAVAAVAVRLVALGQVPLQPGEAADAVAAWCAAGGVACPGGPVGTSPLLFTANFLAFGLMAATDLWARWLPVVAGGVLMGVPYLLRRRLGQVGALGAGVVLALSATVVYFGRHASPDALAVTFASLAWAATVADAGEGRTKRLPLAAVALALALAAGSAVYTVLLALGTWAILAQVLGDRLPGEPLGSRWWGLVRADAAGQRKALVAGGAAFLLTATAFSFRFLGVGLAADLLGRWLTRFGASPTYPWCWTARVLLLQEPLILLVGLAGLVLAVRRRDRFGLFLGWWALVGLVVSFAAGGRQPDDVMTVLVPLALLAGQGLDALLAHLREREVGQPEGGFLVFALALLVFGYVQMAAYSRTGDGQFLLLAAIPAVLIVGLSVLWWLWHGRDVALRGLALFVLIWAAWASLAVAGHLNFGQDVGRMEGMVAEETTPGMRDLVAWLERLSAQRHVDPHALPLLVGGYDRPLLRWYLREFPQTRFVAGLANPPEATVVLAPPERELPLGETFSGQDFEIVRRGLTTQLAGRDLVRWLLFRDNVAAVEHDALVLWVQREETVAGP